MKKTSYKTPITGVVTIVLLGAVLLWHSLFANLLWRVATPLFIHPPISNLTSYFQSKAALARDNDMLRAALASTSAALADRDALYRENLELKARMGRDAGQHTLLAGVVLRPPLSPYDTLIIDAGSAEGVAVGALVSAGGTTIIGEVDTVYKDTSRVMLFSAPGESYQAILMESSAHGAVPLSVSGRGGGSMSAEVPAATAASVGDSVLFPGVAGGITSSVVAVNAPQGNSFETLYLRLPVNVEELRFVEVLTP